MKGPNYPELKKGVFYSIQHNQLSTKSFSLKNYMYIKHTQSCMYLNEVWVDK